MSKALVKFLQSANLNNEYDGEEALKLMNEWSPISIEDALPLLSIKFAANGVYKSEIASDLKTASFFSEIRKKAISCLENLSIDEI